LERKIARIQGERTEEEKFELQSRIDHLTKVLDEKIATEKMLQQQLHRQDLALRQGARERETLQAAEKELNTKLNEINLDQDSLDRASEKARTQREQLIVEINMLRLQVDKLSSQLNAKADQVVSLENRREQLKLSMKERVDEIEAHLAALRVQLKTEDEARHDAVVELAERKRRLEGLKANLQTEQQTVDGEEVSPSYFVIKFAQQREELSRRGDELENEVKVAIQELRALEHSMVKLNGQNAAFRAKFDAVGDGDYDFERKETLDEQRKTLMQRLNALKMDARSAAEERAALERTYDQQQRKISQIQAELAQLKPAIERLRIENAELGEKIKRANTTCNRAKEAHRRSARVSPDAPFPASLFEMDVEVTMQQQMLDFIVSELSRISEANPEIERKLNAGFTQIGLRLPQSPIKPPKLPTIATPVSSGRSSGSSRPSTESSSRSKGSHVSIVSVGGDFGVEPASGRSQGSPPGIWAAGRPSTGRGSPAVRPPPGPFLGPSPRRLPGQGRVSPRQTRDKR
jgi:chromosome segregation ATPase